MSVASFAEESCWQGDRFRQVRKSVAFRITSVGKLDGVRVDEVFRADYGIWYDPEDDYLLGHLQKLPVKVEWGRLVFYKKHDHSGIEIFDPEDEDKLVGSIVVQRRMGGDPSGEEDRTGIICLATERKKRQG